MMHPRCAIGMKSDTTVVSFPPCGSRRGSEGGSRFSIQLPLKPQTTKAVNECLQLRRRVPKTRRGAKYDPIGPLYVGMRWSSVLGEHPLAPFFPAGNFGHYIRRNQIGY